MTVEQASHRRIGVGHVAGAAGAAVALGATVAYRARFVTPYRPRLERVSFVVPPGHQGLAGIRIGFVTDTHVGPLVSVGNLERGLDLLRAAQPDLYLLGGDFISDSPRYADLASKSLGALADEAPLGAIAVLGNHDVSNDARRAERVLRQADIIVLRNAAHRVVTDGGDLWIAGIDENILAVGDPAATFAGIPPGAAVLALWHEPDWADDVAALGAFAQLSGHSHGGQVHLPMVGTPFAPPGGRRYSSGLHDASGMPVYTSRGLGFYRPPVRLNCPPEVTLVTLAIPSGA